MKKDISRTVRMKAAGADSSRGIYFDPEKHTGHVEMYASFIFNWRSTCR